MASHPCCRSSLLLRLPSLLLLLLLSLLLPLFTSADDFSTVSVSFYADGSPQLAMNDLTSAYILQQPSVSIVMTKVTLVPVVVSSITSELADFAMLSSELTTNQAVAYPTLQMYPTMANAIVPIYRLDALGVGAPQLVLSRPLLSQIYMGLVTWWNDSAITSLNPALTFPHQRITIVVPPANTATNKIFTTALSKFYPPFNASIGISNAPSWPTAAYYRTVVTSTVVAQAATVIAIDGSIGYCFLQAANQASVSVAAMINKAGSVVQANADSITFATVELGTAPRARTTSLMDLTDATGTSVWPICIMSFLLIDTSFSRSTCHVRAAVVEFWTWFYTSSVAAGLLASRQYASVPAIMLTQLSVMQALSSVIQCRGAVALPAIPSTTRVMGAPISIAFLATLFANSYQSEDASIVWEVQQNTDQVITEQLVNSEVDIAFVNFNNIDPELYAAVMADPSYLVMPTFLLADAVAYNPQITANVSLAGHTLTLDMRTIGMIQYSCIFYWNDPIIVAQNPWLAALLPPISVTEVPIIQIQGCGTVAPLESALLAAIQQYVAASNDTVLTECMAAYPSYLWDSWYACQSVPSMGLMYTPNEAAVPALVLGTVGSMGVMQATGDPSYGIVVITDYRDGVWTNTSATIAGMFACASDTFTAVSLFSTGIPLGLSPASHNRNCYRATQQVTAIVRSGYSADATDTSSCTRGYDALAFLSWFINTPAIDVLVESVNTVRVTSLASAIYQLELDSLNEVVCDQQTLLVTLPVPWSLSSGVYTFVVLFASIGIVACIGLAVFVFRYRHHPVIRSASPLFLLLSIFGLLVLFAAGYLLVSSVSQVSCAAFSWLVNVGLMLTFSPLFAKTWRIYRIFGRKKLSVVTISNRRLLAMVAALLCGEALLMAVWQGVGQLQPIVLDVQTSQATVSSVAVIASRLRVDEYVQCGVPAGAAQSMFIVICVEKGLLFVWGALMAFTTRKVSSTFNEAQGITLALYNTCFTIGIIAPIILVIQATGDVLDLLLAFALLWIALFTAGILFGPKILTIYSKAEADAGNNSVMASSSSSSGYAFMSLAALSSVGVLQGYLAALKKHTGQVEEKLVKLKRTHQAQFAGQHGGAGGGGGGDGASGTRPSISAATSGAKARGDEAKVLTMGGGDAGPGSPLFRKTPSAQATPSHQRIRSSMSSSGVGGGGSMGPDGSGSRTGSPAPVKTFTSAG